MDPMTMFMMSRMFGGGGGQGSQGHSTLDWLGTIGGMASPLLGALGGLFGGAQDRKDQKQGRSMLKGMYDQPTYNIPKLTSLYNRSYQSQIEPMAQQYAGRYGLNSGRMMQEMMSSAGGGAADFLGNATMRGNEADMMRKMQIAQALYGAGRG